MPPVPGVNCSTLRKCTKLRLEFCDEVSASPASMLLHIFSGQWAQQCPDLFPCASAADVFLPVLSLLHCIKVQACLHNLLQLRCCFLFHLHYTKGCFDIPLSWM